jgi:hypothetical protein
MAHQPLYLWEIYARVKPGSTHTEAFRVVGRDLDAAIRAASAARTARIIRERDAQEGPNDLIDAEASIGPLITAVSTICEVDG